MLIIAAPCERVFKAVATPEGLQNWWTSRSKGRAEQGGTYRLRFGPGFDWTANVPRFASPEEVELELGGAHGDWEGTRINIRLEERKNGTVAKFRHQTGWTGDEEDYALANYCWGQYLRTLKQHLETGDQVPFGRRG